ncbi:helix-turn-helix domain-containing protein [Microbacterium lacticum]|uniref:helix-turn-helix domain-containing protein n=1 Tax=Microbacterium lacticum TaxID=33885 RepID=UPI002594622C|nr:helix-turn-helix transcriptional regulator [Microbacterium lacticum]
MTDSSPPSFGEVIRDARKKREWSQEMLAEKAGVSRPTIARVERGDDVSTANLTKIADVLGLQILLAERETESR